jgi:hypothetical protein
LRKFGIIAVLSLIIAAVAAVPALAANPHPVKSGEPLQCTLNNAGTRLTCSGELAGLGNVDAIRVTVDVTGGCETRSGSNQPPGHIQSTSPRIPVTENGRATFEQSVSVRCPGGLNPFFGDEATIIVRDADTGEVLFRRTIDIT